MRSILVLAVVLVASRVSAFDEVLIGVNLARSTSVFNATAGHEVEYSPLSAINKTTELAHEAFNQWAVTNNWGLAGFNVLNSYPSADSPVLTVTIDGLDEPRYEVFARVFVNSAPFPPEPGVNTHSYAGKFALADEDFQIVSFQSNGTLLSQGQFGQHNGWFQIREYHLGAADAIGGELSIRVDDFAGQMGHSSANVAGFRLIVVPEPGSLVMAAVGMLLLHRQALGKRRSNQT